MKHIENLSSSIRITNSELKFAKDMADSYMLYIVYGEDKFIAIDNLYAEINNQDSRLTIELDGYIIHINIKSRPIL